MCPGQVTRLSRERVCPLPLDSHGMEWMTIPHKTHVLTVAHMHCLNPHLMDNSWFNGFKEWPGKLGAEVSIECEAIWCAWQKPSLDISVISHLFLGSSLSLQGNWRFKFYGVFVTQCLQIAGEWLRQGLLVHLRVRSSRLFCKSVSANRSGC